MFFGKPACRHFASKVSCGKIIAALFQYRVIALPSLTVVWITQPERPRGLKGLQLGTKAPRLLVVKYYAIVEEVLPYSSFHQTFLIDPRRRDKSSQLNNIL